MAADHGEGNIQWNDNFPKDQPAYIQVVSPKGGAKTYCVITSERWIGVYTHYIDNRTRPCTGSELDCEGCFQRRGRRWKAYLCGVFFGIARKCIIELTQGAMESCPGIIPSDCNLRGKKITLWRRSAAKNAPVHCRLDALPPGETIPPPFDLRAALFNVWGYTPNSPTENGGGLYVPVG